MSRSTIVVIHGSKRVQDLVDGVLEIAHGPEAVLVNAEDPWAEVVHVGQFQQVRLGDGCAGPSTSSPRTRQLSPTRPCRSG
ncbi:hypothetical protein [Paenarthrobacter aromaticivorans]|uniref:hypothetical protein n=1 Tax=Paenarthrobacter aromaticivorans TaxID=2849150 RepID=UPI0027E0BD75|nr:hypothetical protein [Paenarthrobacter sp. MMS21-TAE1-1]